MVLHKDYTFQISVFGDNHQFIVNSMVFQTEDGVELEGPLTTEDRGVCVQKTQIEVVTSLSLLESSLKDNEEGDEARRREAEEQKNMVLTITEKKAKFGGYNSTLDSLREIIELKVIKKRINNIKGILLHGPSGIGKTMAIETVLQEKSQHGINLIKLTPADLVKEEDPFKRVQRVFKFATRQAPCILLIEEIDFLTKSK
jgi:SpoVK/Ycf46/Vps4 family AAA+-type ATPase